MMKTILTLDVLKTMFAGELGDYRAAGEDFRRELTHAVMRDLSCPASWDVNGEYKSDVEREDLSRHSKTCLIHDDHKAA